MHINHQFLELCKKDAHLDLATDDMTDVEPIMVELLELIEHNLDNRPMFAYFSSALLMDRLNRLIISSLFA